MDAATVNRIVLMLVVLVTLLLTICAAGTVASAAEVPVINWQKCLGGTGTDTANAMQLTADGGYIVAGGTFSYDGDVTGNHKLSQAPPTSDFWVVKLDGVGGLVWQKCLGGGSDESANSVQQTADGGYIVAGQARSVDGDVIGLHGGVVAGTDAWVVKLNASGGLVWQKCLGGSSPYGRAHDSANAVQQTADGGYILAGYTASDNGDVTGYHGGYDAWVVKLDASGGLVWQRCLGGTSYDMAQAVQQTADGGYILAGYTNSVDGDVAGIPTHVGDIWIVKLNAAGGLVWQKCLGGTKYDGPSSMQLTADGGCIIAGNTESNDGDVTGNHGATDAWVVKLDAGGTLVWQRCLGGANADNPSLVRQTADGGYIVAGETRSTDGDFTGNRGLADAWVVKLNASGGLVWQKCLGGTNYDGANAVQQTADGGYILSGYTSSTDGDVIGNHGNSDCWVVKLGPPLPYAGMTITRPGFYTLDSNRDYGNWDIGILIASSDVVLDGMGYGVEGFNVEGSLGISVIGDGDAPLHNITIRNISLRYWNCGIEVNGATDFTIENVLSEWNTDGIWISNPNENRGIITASTFRNNLMNGISLDYTGQITVEHCSIYSNREGMYLYEAGMGSGDGPVLLTDNLVFSNRGNGIYVGFSRGVAIRNNTIRENDGDGIEIYRCEALVEGNRIENNRWGGVGTDYNGGGSVIGNWITGNSYGIGIGGMESGIGEAWNNMLNNTEDGNYGWEGMESLPCVLNTTKTAGLNIVGGPYLGGNYWANPNGAGYSQTCTDADEDGICDAPYFAGWGGTDTFTDYLPLAIPPTSPPNPLLLVPGGTHLPTDTNADRKYDDVNGNDRRDFADVVLYFNQMSWISANEPLSAFDYNGNGRIDFADVVWLFNNL